MRLPFADFFRHPRLVISLIGLAFALTACTTPSAGPTPDAPELIGGQALPKSLATVFISATPSPAPITATLGPSLSPVPLTSTLTPTLTLYVGHFLGAQTLTPLVGTFAWQPTQDAKIVILTARPNFHPTAQPIAYNGLTPIAPGLPIGVAIENIGGGSANGAVTIPPPGTPHPCTVAVAAQFANAYAHNPSVMQSLGCPTDGGYGLNLVIEHFQTGVMIWHDTHEIFALNFTGGTAQSVYWRIPDVWTDGMPASDPSLQPPAGLIQPTRGFGYAWRSNPPVRAGLGWATESEHAYNGFWQNFEHGLMLTDSGSAAFALIPLSTAGGAQFGTLAR